jgi:hypothetical protein
MKKKTKTWKIKSNNLDCLYELVSPLGIIVMRYPTVEQAKDSLELILETINRSSTDESKKEDPV